jgi:hypothetical protein
MIPELQTRICKILRFLLITWKEFPGNYARKKTEAIEIGENYTESAEYLLKVSLSIQEE